MKKPVFIDLFAGCGGLSEGFIRAGFSPVAHVESDGGACNSLKTRMAYHWLKKKNNIDIYSKYLKGKITREQLYKHIPESILKSVIHKEINTKNINKIISMIHKLKKHKSIDIIIGGPPCQAYSLVGRSRDKFGMIDDPRNYLYIQYGKFLKEFKPEYFIFENVIGLLSAKSTNGRKYLEDMLLLFKLCGYSTEFKILDANDHGVLQKRKRIILIGKKGEKNNFFPEIEKINIKKMTVSEIFRDLPMIKAGEGKIKYMPLKKYNRYYLFDAQIRTDFDFITWHIARPHTTQDKEIYKIAVEKWNAEKERLKYDDLPEKLKSHKNRADFYDRFKVVASDIAYSHTVVAHIAKDGHYYIHPDIRQNRSLTPREAARLQSFPDDYFFESATDIDSRTSVFRQIGNAVPVLLAEKIAQGIIGIM